MDVSPLCRATPAWQSALSFPHVYLPALMVEPLKAQIRQGSAFSEQGNASLARAYRLFRTMGLHHLLVGPAKPQIMGIITRKVCIICPARQLLNSKPLL